jgi:hypothetical protein
MTANLGSAGVPSASSLGVSPSGVDHIACMVPGDKDFTAAKEATLNLLVYCQSRNWAGYDPYDALNSRIFKALPFLNSRIPRLALTQALKRCPINLRPLFLISGTQNPKGLALFLQAVMRLSKLGLIDGGDEIAKSLAKGIEQLRSPNTSFWCWGYSFPWQTRTQLVPARTPNLVCTLFVAEALLDFYEATEQEHYLNIAASAADYIVKELYWENDATCSFSYPFPSSRTPVHNANLLAAAFLCRVSHLIGGARPSPGAATFATPEAGDPSEAASLSLTPRFSEVNVRAEIKSTVSTVSPFQPPVSSVLESTLPTGNKKYLTPALNAARYSVKRQRTDGSWLYGESNKYAWVDNFHTGYNLCALRNIGKYLETAEFDQSLRIGFEFYRNHFFRDDAAPKYFHDRTYPIDVHCVAQSLITLLELKDLHHDNINLARRVFSWSLANLQDDDGYFYHQKLPFGTIKIPYMRWGQAWMLVASSLLLEKGFLETSGGADHHVSPKLERDFLKTCPGGTPDNSPTFQGWVADRAAKSPGGTAELCIGNSKSTLQ